MSKGNKEEQKWLLGESLNQYDRSLKEELNKVEKRNREQNHKISALINAFDDDYIKKEEENTNISLDYSKEGIVIVDDIKGNTLVNNVKDSNKELILNGDIDTQGIDVTLENTVNNGKVDVSLEGNTEVNLSKTKDPIMITHKFDDINSNNGKLQTTVNGVTTINDSPGKVDIKEITGDTLVNHVSNGSEELILNGNIDTSGYSNITTTEGVDGGKVDISLEGNTMVNVCDQQEPVTITKSYTVDTGNHVALQGDYNGKCRPVLNGNTMVNLAKDKDAYSYKNDIIQNNVIHLTHNLKAGVTYTLIRTISEFSGGVIQEAINFYDMSFYTDGKQAQDHNCQYRGNGQYISTYTPTKDVVKMEIIIGMDNINKDKGIYPTITISDYMILEGDYTNKPIPNYFTGLQSSFENQLITDENDEHYGKYKVNYKVTGKNKVKLIPNNLYKNAGTMTIDSCSDNQLTFSITDNTDNWQYIRHKLTGLKPNTDYVCSFTISSGDTSLFARIYANSSSIDTAIEGDKTKRKFNTSNYDNIYIRFFGILDTPPSSNTVTYSNIQIEEGTTATTYEPYKEYNKTFYLNSPLLEGDTIEDVNGKATHVHRYGKVVLDGSNYVPSREKTLKVNDYYRWQFNKIPNLGNSTSSNIGIGICDKYPTVTPTGTWNSTTEGITQNSSGNTLVLYLDRYKDGSDTSKASLIAGLQQNPATVVYKLANPTYETISNDSILCDSYVNGHLDVDSVVPIEKVDFKQTIVEGLKYLNPNTEYIIQFEADNIGKLHYYIGGSYDDINVVKGVNKFNLTTKDKINWLSLDLSGIGFNMSNIVVTPKVNEDFGYFKGMKSVGQDDENGHKIEILSQNKNLFDGVVSPEYNYSDSNFNVSLDGVLSATNKIDDSRPWGYDTSQYKMKLKKGNYTITLETLTPSTNYYSQTAIYKKGVANALFIFGNDTMNAVGSNAYRLSLNEDCIIGIMSKFFDGTFRIQIEKGEQSTTFVPYKSNKKEILLNEPLRSLPNGTKDKIVLIDGKWYIERNTMHEIFDGSDDENWILSGYDNNRVNGMTFRIKKNTPKSNGALVSTCIRCDKLKNITPKEAWGANRDDTEVDSSFIGISTGTKVDDGIDIRIPRKALVVESVSGFKQWLQKNPITVVYQIATPIYEPLEIESTLNTYTDITHISNNSLIPCNMVIKNSGYNTISLKENTKYTAYVNNKNNVSLTYKIDDNAIAVNSSNKFTFTTPSTLVDKTIRIASKGSKIENLMIIEGTPQNDPIGYFDGLKSSYECEKITDANDENYNKYKVDIRVKGENFESTQIVYLNSPLLKGDKITWKDNKLQHYHKMKSIVVDGSDDEKWSVNKQLTDYNSTQFTWGNALHCIKDVNNQASVLSDKIPSVKGDVNENNIWVYNGNTLVIHKKLSTVSELKKYLQQNPITVVYELETPYYEIISEYPLKFSNIANCSLSTISNIQVSNISFNIYEETLPYLYNDKKYYITFNSDISREIIINLGGSELVYTTKVGFNKVEITTPSNSNNMLTFNGQGVNINNVKVTQQNINDYFEGMKSVGECEDLEIVSNNNDNTLSNKQTMIHEPLRGLPNGVKDKYVIIDGKWYIERNIRQKLLTGADSEKWLIHSNNDENVIEFRCNTGSPSIISNSVTTISDKFIGKSGGNIDRIAWAGDTLYITISRNKLATVDVAGLRQWLSNNNVLVQNQLATPTYEPINYNPFEVYTNITHISNNSLIPCNMVIKNSGYNCILKPNTKYTVVTNTQNSISAKIGNTKVDSTNNVFTIVTPSTLTDNVLRFSGKGLTTKDIMLLEGDKTNYIPKYFTGMESAFEQEYDKEKNKYKVNVKVTDGNKENNITFYINEPLRGVGDVKDKVYVKEDKVVVERNCGKVVLDGSENNTVFSREENATIEFKIPINSVAYTVGIKSINNKLSNFDGKDEKLVCGYGHIYIRLFKSKLQTQDINGFKQWLQENPTTVIYQLAEPTYEEVESDLSKLMLENYENSSLILNSNIPPTVNVRYKGEVPIVSATKELSSNVKSTTTDINENIIPYMCDMDYRIVELQLKNVSTQGLEVNILGLDSEDVLFNNRKANKIFNPSYEMLKRDILSKRYSSDEYRYRLERYLLANKISNEEYNELEGLIDGK